MPTEMNGAVQMSELLFQAVFISIMCSHLAESISLTIPFTPLGTSCAADRYVDPCSHTLDPDLELYSPIPSCLQLAHALLTPPWTR